MNYKIFKGKNPEEIKINALKELDLQEDEVIIQEKKLKKGIIHNIEYEITIIPLKEIELYLNNYLKKLINIMGIEVKLEDNITNKRIYIDIISNDNSVLIGKNGKNLESFQLICKRFIKSKFKISLDVVLDVEGYKEKQYENLKKDVIKIAREVEKTNTIFELDNMNSYERRIVHETLKSFTNIKTESIGEEPNRHIVIKPIK
jgi:spoIIIJ-associated protein